MMTDRRQRKSLGSQFAAMLCQYLLGYRIFYYHVDCLRESKRERSRRKLDGSSMYPLLVQTLTAKQV